MKKGFTLIELLVVITIIGLLAGAIMATLRSSINKAKGANVASALKAIDDAFVYKALDENVTAWWHEDDFPSTNSWAAYIEDLVNDDVISTFLPAAPDYPNPDDGSVFEYAYDQDDDVFVNPGAGDPACFDYVLTYDGSWGQWNQLKGVNIVIYPNLHPNSEEFQDTFNYLDEVIDGGDGPYCGRMTNDSWNGHHNDQKRHHYFRYRIDYDLEPNH